MSTQQSSLTYEGVLEMFRETREQIKEIAQLQKETDRIAKQTQKEVAKLGSRIGEIVENMVRGNIVGKFRKLDYVITRYSPNTFFDNHELDVHGEIDLFLENGDIAILIEVKTTLKTEDVREHIERIEKFRRCTDASGGDKRRYIGAVAGAVVSEETTKYAHKNGMYVIVQSGDAVEIVPQPEGFVAKKW